MRISRNALSMFSAESLPSPRRFLNTRCSFSDRFSNMRVIFARTRGRRAMHWQCTYNHYNLLGGWRRDADAAGRHLPCPVHPQLVEDARAGPKVRRQPFGQSRDVKEDIPAAVVRPEKPEAFGFEVRHHAAGLL